MGVASPRAPLLQFLEIMTGALNIVLPEASDFSMFLSFVHRTHLPITLLLLIHNAKSVQRLLKFYPS